MLWGVDALISDYSSILIDFVATGRPVLLLAPDLESYRDSRGLYFDYQWLAGDSWATDWDQLLDRLASEAAQALGMNGVPDEEEAKSLLFKATADYLFHHGDQ